MIDRSRRQAIVDMYNSGMTVDETSNATGVSRAYVSQIIIAEGISRRRGRPSKHHLTEEQKIEARRLVNIGVNYTRVGRKFGITGAQVRKELER